MSRLLILGFVLLGLAGAGTAQPSVVYEIRFPNRVHHEAEVSLVLTDVPAGPLRLRMSRSSPGRYALHEFAKNVYNLQAVDGRGRSLPVVQPDPYSWTVPEHDGAVTVTYTLFADRADGTYSGIDNTHAHLNMPATFLWAGGLTERPIRITFHRPEPDWQIATQLVPTDEPETYTAPNLYYFLDSPTEISPFELRTWTVPAADGTVHTIRLAVHHDGTAEEVDAYAAMAQQVVAEQGAVWGTFPAFDDGTYTFIACYLPHVSGDGMEHRNSTILTSTAALQDRALGLLGTVSHEFFHAWNVERLRPRTLEPFDFTEANPSGALWFAEGFTSYYDDLILHRAGLTSLEQYAHGLSGLFNYVLRSPGRQFFSAVEMSRQAPFVDAATSIDPVNRINTFISYYSWGAMIGLGLDLTLRTRFDVTLDAYLRALWTRHGEPEIPYTLADLERVLGEVADDPAFATDFFDRYIRGHEVVDYEALLAEAGVLLRQVRPGEPFLGDAPLASAEGGGVRIEGPTQIGRPLYDAGLDRGDVILQVDAQPLADLDRLQAILATHQPGDALTLTIRQRGEMRTTRLVLIEDPTLELVTFEEAGWPVTDGVRVFRERWLRTQTLP